MLTGWQLYTVGIPESFALTVPPMSFSVAAYPEVDKVEIEAPTGEWLSIKITYKEVASQAEARSKGQVIADQTVDRLAFNYGIPIRDPLIRNDSFHAVGGEDHGLVSTTVHAPCIIIGKKETSLTPEDWPELKTSLEAGIGTKAPYLSEYRWILRHEDPAVRFVYLYRMLLFLVGNGDQDSLDQFIVSRDPGIRTVAGARRNGRTTNKTIFTHLRDALAHKIPNTSSESIREQMRSHVGKLADHVKAAIARLK